MMLRRTLFLMSVCGIAAFLALGARLCQIQIFQHDEYEAAAIAQQVRETTVSAARGTIYDRNGAILAISAGVDTVYISPAEIERNNEDKEAIARGLSYEAARQRLGELGLYLTAENGVTDPAAQLVSAQSTAPGEELAHGSVVGVTLYENEASMLGEY